MVGGRESTCHGIWGERSPTFAYWKRSIWRPSKKFIRGCSYVERVESLGRKRQYEYATKASVFFCVKLKSGRESHFWPYFQFFFTGKNRFSRPLFSTFLGFFTATFCFHAHFCDFFHGLKIWFHAQNFRNFHGFLYF